MNLARPRRPPSLGALVSRCGVGTDANGAIALNNPDLRSLVLNILRHHLALTPPPVNPNASLPSLQIVLYSHHGPLLDAFASFVLETREAVGGTGTGMRTPRMAVQKWSVLSSPHVHKTAWTQFERRTHERVLQIRGLGGELARRMIWYLQQHAPPDVRIKCTMYEYVPMCHLRS